MKIALVYDRVNKFGGAERILLALHRLWPKAPLYTAVYNPASAPWAKGIDIRPSWLNKWPLAKTHHELYPWLTAMAFESFNFDDYDVVVSVTSAEAKAIITKPQTLHLCYCLTPTRYLWSHYRQYQTQPGLGVFSRPARWGLKMLRGYLQKEDLVLATRPDEYLAISQTVKKRIKRYYKQDAEVIYPPVETIKFARSLNLTKLNWLPKEYYLLVSRLVTYKRISLAIKVFNRLNLPLIIVGSGFQKDQLRNQAGANIIFLDNIKEKELTCLYQKARALIMPQEEDFGLVSLEAQAAGTPVIAFKRGGATETIIDGKTGILFAKATVDSLLSAVKKSRSRHWDYKLIRKHAQKFNQSRFEKQITAKLDKAWQKHQK